MSADNYYIVRRHPDGGFTPVMGFASDQIIDGVWRNDIHPEATEDHPEFNDPYAALDSVINEYAEYGAVIHDECFVDAEAREWSRASNNGDYYWSYSEDYQVEAFIAARTIQVGSDRWLRAVREADDWLEGLEKFEPDDRIELAAGIARDVLKAAGFVIVGPKLEPPELDAEP